MIVFEINKYIEGNYYFVWTLFNIYVIYTNLKILHGYVL